VGAYGRVLARQLRRHKKSVCSFSHERNPRRPGDTGYEVGEATLAIGTGTAVVKFVVWKKIDGQWRLHSDIWNSRAA
jgi:hypothetical protein